MHYFSSTRFVTRHRNTILYRQHHRNNIRHTETQAPVTQLYFTSHLIIILHTTPHHLSHHQSHNSTTRPNHNTGYKTWAETDQTILVKGILSCAQTTDLLSPPNYARKQVLSHYEKNVSVLQHNLWGISSPPIWSQERRLSYYWSLFLGAVKEKNYTSCSGNCGTTIPNNQTKELSTFSII